MSFSIQRDFESVLLNGLTDYIRGRVDEIVASHLESARTEIEKAIREEAAKTVLQLGKYVSFKDMSDHLVISIHDVRGTE